MYCYYKVKWNFDDEMLTNYGFAQGENYADIVAGIDEAYDCIENIEVEWIGDNSCTLDLEDILDSLTEEQLSAVLVKLMKGKAGAGSAVFAAIQESSEQAIALEDENVSMETHN